jgi:hypothetical protein
MPGASKFAALVWALMLAGLVAMAVPAAAETRTVACPDGHTCPAVGPAPVDAPASVGKPSPSVETPIKTEVAKKNRSLRWNIQNRSGRRVEMQLFSQDRRWVWPNTNRVYVLPNSQKYTIDITCRQNEKICYGAWLASNTRTYWGVGYRGTRDCRGCCYICGRGQTPLIQLVR